MMSPDHDLMLPHRLPAEERTIALQTIADRTKLSIDGAEFLLMKALSLHLIEGVIDEVDSSVQVRCGLHIYLCNTLNLLSCCQTVPRN